jgi:hypothetical protein
MSMSVVLLPLSFVLSLGGLFIFIASMTRGLFGTAEEGSRVIFAPDEESTSEEPGRKSRRSGAAPGGSPWCGGFGDIAGNELRISRHALRPISQAQGPCFCV